MDVIVDFGGLSPICAIACLQKHSFWTFFGPPGAVSLHMKSLEELGEGLKLLRLCLLGDLGYEGVVVLGFSSLVSMKDGRFVEQIRNWLIVYLSICSDTPLQDQA